MDALPTRTGAYTYLCRTTSLPRVKSGRRNQPHRRETVGIQSRAILRGLCSILSWHYLHMASQSSKCASLSMAYVRNRAKITLARWSLFYPEIALYQLAAFLTRPPGLGKMIARDG